MESKSEWEFVVEFSFGNFNDFPVLGKLEDNWGDVSFPWWVYGGEPRDKVIARQDIRLQSWTTFWHCGHFSRRWKVKMGHLCCFPTIFFSQEIEKSYTNLQNFPKFLICGPKKGSKSPFYLVKFRHRTRFQRGQIWNRVLRERGGGVITPSVPYFRIYIWLSQWSLHLKLLYDSDFFPSAFWSTINKDVYEIFVASKVFIIISLSIFKLTQKNSFEYAR